MPDDCHAPTPVIANLPDVTFRQLEIFSLVCREGSYANAAIEAHSTRANIKRICKSLERSIDRQLIDENSGGQVSPSAFGRELLEQARPLARSLCRLGDLVNAEHESGRIVRFAASPALFQAGMFTEFVRRLGALPRFRPCFLRLEKTKFRSALLNAECDVYFGIGLDASPRFDSVDLGPAEKPAGERLIAVLRKHHPYTELMPLLAAAARR